MITFAQYLGSLREAIVLNDPHLESELEWEFDAWNKKEMTFEFRGDRFRVRVEQGSLDQLHVGSRSRTHAILESYARRFGPEYFEIMFLSDDHGMNVPNLYGQGATAIYNLVAIAVKKMMEGYEAEGSPVNLIKYYGVRDYTDVIYHRLFDRLLSADFVRVHEQYIMKKSVFHQLAEEKRSLYMAQAEEDALHNMKIADLMRDRAELRKERVNLRKSRAEEKNARAEQMRARQAEDERQMDAARLRHLGARLSPAGGTPPGGVAAHNRPDAG